MGLQPGEAEQGLGRLGIPRLDILRPGLLRGPREELRVGEKIGMLVSPLADLLMADVKLLLKDSQG